MHRAATENAGSQDEGEAQHATRRIGIPGQKEKGEYERTQAQERGMKVGGASFVVVRVGRGAALQGQRDE